MSTEPVPSEKPESADLGEFDFEQLESVDFPDLDFTPVESVNPPVAASEPAAPVNSPAPTATSPEPAFGWTGYAELINGRFAMVGFIGLLVLEFFTRQDFFTWLGLR